MSITEAPNITTLTLDDVHELEVHAVQTVAAVRAECNEKIRVLEAAVARDAEERDRLRLAADGLEAATFALVADHLRREEALRSELRQAAGKAEAHRRIIAGLEGLLGDYYRAHYRVAEHNGRLVEEVQRGRIELDAEIHANRRGGRFRWGR